MSAPIRMGAGAPHGQATAARERRSTSARSALRFPRLAAFAGLASFDLIIIAAFVAPPLWNAPGTGASGARVSAYAQHYASRSTAALLIYSIAMGLFMCFAAGLWAWLREREGAPHALSSVFAFAAIALVILILAAFVPGYMLSYRTQPSVIAGPLADLGFGLLALSGLPTALCLASYATLVTRLRCLPPWTAWLAGAGALAHVLIAASFVSHGGFLSLESSVIVWVPATFFAWIFATSAALLRKPPSPAVS